METILKLNQIHKSYGGKEVLKGVSLDVQKGEIISVLGPSGCGKSTLLNIIAGILPINEGQVLLNGVEVTSPGKMTPIEKRDLNMVFQDFALWPHMTARENVLYGLKLRKISKQEQEEKLQKMVDLLHLNGLMEQYPAELSGGQQQRVAIARALATNPKILLCDEATSALDPTTTRSILALLKEINKTLGITIIVITHEMAVIEEICQRVAIIDSSRIAEVGTVDEVFTRPKSAMAKQLIYPDGKRNSLATGKRYCRIVFDGNSSFEPVISNMVLECKAPVNIMFADTKNMDGKAYGQMILQLPEDERAAKRALAYLETQNVHAEEVADYASV